LFYLLFMFNLTANQRKVFDAIAEYIPAHGGMSPTVREIMDITGIKGSAGVAMNLDALEERGWIKRLPHRRRSITIVDAAKEADHA
jgi:repressor LexA